MTPPTAPWTASALQARGNTVTKLMEGVDYAKVFEGLPPYCTALMQNVG